jgi:hypothetical protein
MRTKATIRLPAVFAAGNALASDGVPEPATAFDCTSVIPAGGCVVVVVVGAAVVVLVVVLEACDVAVVAVVPVAVVTLVLLVVVTVVVVVVVAVVDVVVAPAGANVASTALQLVAALSANVPAYAPDAAAKPVSVAARDVPVSCRCSV